MYIQSPLLLVLEIFLIKKLGLSFFLKSGSKPNFLCTRMLNWPSRWEVAMGRSFGLNFQLKVEPISWLCQISTIIDFLFPNSFSTISSLMPFQLLVLFINQSEKKIKFANIFKKKEFLLKYLSIFFNLVLIQVIIFFSF